MKRILILIPVIMILLTGCKNNSHTLDTEYSGELCANDGQTEYTADLDCSGDSLSLTFSAPDTVKGLRYEFRGDELHTSLNGLDCVTAVDSLPPDSIPALTAAVFLHGDEAEYQSTEDGKDAFLIDRGCAVTVTAIDSKPETIVSGNRTISLR